MKNSRISTKCAAFCVAGMLFLGTSVLAGDADQGQKAGKRAQRLDKMIARVGARIQKLQGRAAKHPNASEAVKTATGKLVNALSMLKIDLTAAKLNIAGQGKAARKAAWQTIKADRQTVHADHKALVEARKAAHPNSGKSGKSKIQNNNSNHPEAL